MFKCILIFLTLFCSYGAGEVSAQTGPGLYLSAEDFASNKLLTFGEKSRLHVHQFFNKGSISLSCGDSARDFQKNEVYGYKNKEGDVFRIYRGDLFRIINPGEMILLYKQSRGTGLKGSPVVDTYFFSRTASADVEPLTLVSVLEAFEGDARFELMLELYFRSDEELAAYDAFHKMYKINRLLLLSQELVITHL